MKVLHHSFLAQKNHSSLWHLKRFYENFRLLRNYVFKVVSFQPLMLQEKDTYTDRRSHRRCSVKKGVFARNCGFGHITEEILNGKLHFLCSENPLSIQILTHQTPALR